jgi:hypothetical protein
MQAMDATSASPAWHTWMPQTAHLLVNSDDEILFQQLKHHALFLLRVILMTRFIFCPLLACLYLSFSLALFS